MNTVSKPKALIGDAVHIVGCDCVQTQYGFRIVHLYKGRKYYIHDVRITTSMKTGQVEYDYLLGGKEEVGFGGWVDHSSIEKLVEEETK